MVRTTGDCYQDETLCDSLVTAPHQREPRYWTGDPVALGSPADDVTPVEEADVVGVGVPVSVPVPDVVGVGVAVWLGVRVAVGE